MAPPRLTYFNFAGGRGEPTRLAFVLGGVEFEDNRVAPDVFRREWKDGGRAPWGSLPVLEVDGVVVSQSTALLRFAAKLGNANLYPSDALAALRVDYIVESINELLGKAPRDADADKMREARVAWCAGGLKDALAKLEAEIRRNGNSGFFVGDAITIADLTLHSVVGGVKRGQWDHVDAAVLDACPLLVANYDKVCAHPKVAEFTAKHAPKKE